MDQAFEVHMLNEQGKKKAREIAECFDALLLSLQPHCAGSPREYAITRSKLEEACFFAKKAMANNPDNQTELANAAA